MTNATTDGSCSTTTTPSDVARRLSRARRPTPRWLLAATVVLVVSTSRTFLAAQATSQPTQTPPPPPVASADTVVVPTDYVIGPDDVLLVRFWRNDDMSAEVVVRPDGKISLPLLNEVQAAGLKPDELRKRVLESSVQFVEDPSVTVVVKAINSRKVFITGQVSKPGPYSLITVPTTVLQLIAMAGGLHEYADQKEISIIRTDNGRQIALRFNYQDVVRGRNLKQNIELKPGDTIVVP